MSFLLREVLLEPRRILDLEADGYSQLIPQARSSQLLASLALRLEEECLLSRVPKSVRRHLDSSLVLHEKQKHDLNYDCGNIGRALDSIGERLVLLKGGAYLQAGLPVGRGRLISDIDIIVPGNRIDAAESALKQFGWKNSQLNDYDERYYRRWMHEIPPLYHSRRSTTLDLHHTILPPTADADVDADLLFEELMEVRPGVYTLSWKDMVIHSATHLFHEGEFHHGLRDLWDLDRMLRDFPDRDPSFWEGLAIRGEQLGLSGPLYHGLNYARQVFATPVPEPVMAQVSSRSRMLRQPIMDFLFLRAFRPCQPECRLPLTDLALNGLYVRAHYLRMPLYLLLPHLARKAWIGWFPGETVAGEGAQGEKA